MSADWDILANYESYELVRRDYKSRHGRTPSARHAREIAAPFTHARSYFRSARQAELTVKPLLLYYGGISLSRGLTLMLTRGLREAALVPSHGLSVKDWGGQLAQDHPDFSALQVEVNAAGTFMELARATDFTSLLRINTSDINFRHKHSPVAAGAAFSLGDIVARIPNLRDHNNRWTGEMRCALAELPRQDGDIAYVSMSKIVRPEVTRPVAEAVFAGTSFVFDTEIATHFTFKGPNAIEQLPILTDRPGVLDIGTVVLAALYPGGRQLSKVCTLFLLSYILGMLVRYYPMQWTGLVRGQFDDAALPTLAAAVELVENAFPQVVLDFLAPQVKKL